MKKADSITNSCGRRRAAFTLIELLTVVAIISLLISILMPSLSRARDQAKGVHCLARLKDIANAAAAYENENEFLLPPCEWSPDVEDEELIYGWTETFFTHIWKQPVFDSREQARESFPVQRNVPGRDWQNYFICKASRSRGLGSGHYRVYLPAWVMGSYRLDADRRYDVLNTVLDPRLSASRSMIAPHMPLIGDANVRSERIDISYIDAGEADAAGSSGFNGNRFSDRHYGGTNFLFQDFSAARKQIGFRRRLATDVDLNGVEDVDVGR